MKELTPEQVQVIADLRDWLMIPSIRLASTQKEIIENTESAMREKANIITAILVDVGFEEENDIPF
jgi:hypothetical protein